MMISAESKLSIRRQCRLLAISRASFYYSPKQENADNLTMMQLMDGHILQEPIAKYPESEEYHRADAHLAFFSIKEAVTLWSKPRPGCWFILR